MEKFYNIYSYVVLVIMSIGSTVLMYKYLRYLQKESKDLDRHS
jgi:hypothetical protein